MKINTAAKKITALLLCLAMVFLIGAPQVNAGELEDLYAEYDRLAQKIAESEKMLNSISADKSKQQEIIKELNAQMDALESQIKILNSSIALLQNDVDTLQGTITQYQADIAALGTKITDTGNQITAKQAEIESTRQVALERMRASYMAGSPSKMEILLSSKDLSVFFYNMELLKQLAKQDEALIDKLKGETEALNELKTGMEKDKVNLETVKADLEVKLSDLSAKKAQKDTEAAKYRAAQNSAEAKYESAKALVAKLDKNSAAYKEQLARYEREQEETDRRIDEYIAKYGSSTGDDDAGGNDGVMTWPVPYASVYLSAGYPTYPSGGAHGGIDICVTGGSLGKKIVAAQGGKVISAGWNGSYGNCIIIDHGGGLFTLYGHASKLVVSAGITVDKGQKIGEIGSTGNSTGPHLHFEVRVNSNSSVNRVEPMKYFPGKADRVNVAFSGL